MKYFLPKSLLFCIISITLAFSSFAVDVKFTLNKNKISAEEAAILKIIVSDAESTVAPILPKVTNLTLSSAGQQQSSSWINGKRSSSVTYTYYIMGETAGTFTIPSFVVTADGKDYTTEPIPIQVLSSGNRDGSEKGAEDTNYAFFRVSPLDENKKSFYVGEFIPIKITGYFSERHRMGLKAAPNFIDSAFSLSKLEQQEGQERQTDGKETYLVVTWFGAVTPIKEGEYNFNVSADATVTIQTSRRRSRSIFGSGFFDDPFGRNSVQKPVEVVSPDKLIKVLPLPEKGKPASFDGAIGQFKVQATTSSDKVMVGDPVSLKMIISGRGNYDRVTCPKLADVEKWKVYKANAAFTPGDILGYKGKKVFEQALIPETAKSDAIPSLEFSFFDTGQGKYVTVKTPEIPVIIEDDPNAIQPTKEEIIEEKAAEALKEKEKEVLTTDNDGLAPISITLGDAACLSPIWKNDSYTFSHIIALLLIAGTIYITKRGCRENITKQKKRKKKLQREVTQALKQAEVAARSGETALFFESCAKAIQLQLGNVLKVPSETITSLDIESNFGAHSPELVELFELADAVRYSGQDMDTTELNKWFGILDNKLDTLEVK